MSAVEISAEIVLSSPSPWKLHPACFRDFIFHLYELSNLVTITLPPKCIIVVLTSFHKMEVNIPQHVAVQLIQGHSCQRTELKYIRRTES